MSDVAADPRLVREYPALVGVALAGGVPAAAQHGDASAATCSSARAAPTSAAASRSPATSAIPAAAARRRKASTAGTRCWAAATPASPSIPATGRSPWSPSMPRSTCSGPQGERTIPVEAAASRAGHHAAYRDRAGAGRADPAHSRAGDAARPRLDLPQDPRSGILRLRAGLGGRRPCEMEGDTVRDARIALGGARHAAVAGPRGGAGIGRHSR